MKEILKALREVNEITLKQLSHKTGLTSSYLSNIERGCKIIPTPATINKIAEAFSISSCDFIELINLYKQGDVSKAKLIEMYKTYKYNLLVEQIGEKSEKYNTIAKTLKAIRVVEEITIDDVAKGVGSYYSIIRFYEEGNVKPSAQTISAYAEYFNIDTKSFVQLFELEAKGASSRELMKAYVTIKTES